MKKLVMMCMAAILAGCNAVDMEERVNELQDRKNAIMQGVNALIKD